MFSRFTHGRAVNLVQRRGAKIHFNEIEVPIAEYRELLGQESMKQFDEVIDPSEEKIVRNVSFNNLSFRVSDME